MNPGHLWLLSASLVCEPPTDAVKQAVQVPLAENAPAACADYALALDREVAFGKPLDPIALPTDACLEIIRRQEWTSLVPTLMLSAPWRVDDICIFTGPEAQSLAAETPIEYSDLFHPPFSTCLEYLHQQGLERKEPVPIDAQQRANNPFFRERTMPSENASWTHRVLIRLVRSCSDETACMGLLEPVVRAVVRADLGDPDELIASYCGDESQSKPDFCEKRYVEKASFESLWFRNKKMTVATLHFIGACLLVLITTLAKFRDWAKVGLRVFGAISLLSTFMLTVWWAEIGTMVKMEQVSGGGHGAFMGLFTIPVMFVVLLVSTAVLWKMARTSYEKLCKSGLLPWLVLALANGVMALELIERYRHVRGL